MPPVPPHSNGSARADNPTQPPAGSDAGGSSASPPNPAVRRLSLYLRQLEAFAAEERQTVSSRDLGTALGLGDAQVRKDLANFGQFGLPGVGYRVDDLTGRLRHILGTDRTWPTVLVGCGNIGRALLTYRPFRNKGFHVAAAFDVDPKVIGQTIGGLKIRRLDELGQVVGELDAKLAVLAVPPTAAQEAVDRLVAAGVRGILNFAPVSLSAPPGVTINGVDLAAQLEQIAFQVGSEGR